MGFDFYFQFSRKGVWELIKYYSFIHTVCQKKSFHIEKLKKKKLKKKNALISNK